MSKKKKPQENNNYFVVPNAEALFSKTTWGATGIQIGDEYIPFSEIESIKGDKIYLKPKITTMIGEEGDA